MINLDDARTIMRAIKVYSGPMSMDSLVASIPYPAEDIALVIEFLNEVKGTTVPTPVPTAVVIDTEPLNLMDELVYNYKIAKAVLQTSLIDGRSLDAEETRKSLRTISTFMEQALKLQERLYNAQQLQKFQEAVLDTIATVDVKFKDIIIQRMLEASL